MDNNRIRYNLDEVQRNTFYQMPKFLFNDEFKTLNNDAKVLYMLLKDRHELSIKNSWFDENGDIYFIFTRTEMCEMLGLSKPTVIKAMEHLKKYSLIEEIRIGVNKPNKIYLLSVSNTDIYRKSKIFTSGSKNSLPQEVKNFYHNNTNINNTDINNTSSSKSNKNTYTEIKEIIIDDDIKNIRAIFLENEIKITDTGIKKIIKNKNFSLEKLKVLIEILKTQNYIKNVIGWLTNGLDNFESFKDTFSFKGTKKINNKFNNMESHKRDFEKLEQLEFELLEQDVKFRTKLLNELD